MPGKDPVRIVYATGAGRVCATCGWPASDCRCSTKLDEPVPPRVTAKLRLETRGRGGKSVTVIDGLPRNAPFLDELARGLKKTFGTGGAVEDGAIELQGDRRERLRELLRDKGFLVKG